MLSRFLAFWFWQEMILRIVSLPEGCNKLSLFEAKKLQEDLFRLIGESNLLLDNPDSTNRLLLIKAIKNIRDEFPVKDGYLRQFLGMVSDRGICDLSEGFYWQVVNNVSGGSTALSLDVFSKELVFLLNRWQAQQR